MALPRSEGRPHARRYLRRRRLSCDGRNRIQHGRLGHLGANRFVCRSRSHTAAVLHISVESEFAHLATNDCNLLDSVDGAFDTHGLVPRPIKISRSDELAELDGIIPNLLKCDTIAGLHTESRSRYQPL